MADRPSVTRRHGTTTRALASERCSWASLPAEIRLMILDAIVQQKHPGWASSAAVCKEWQLFIEPRNFDRLKLRASCLDENERLIVRQRHLIRHISLGVELQRYSCRSCTREESESWGRRNDSIIDRGFGKLLGILSTWEPTAHGLTLELNAFCPCDLEHWFNGQQATAPPPSAAPPVFERIELRFPDELPRVDAVTCLIIRRQLRRRIPPYVMFPLLRIFPRLESLVYEPWGLWQRGDITLRDIHFDLLIQKQLPPTLKKVTIFEDFNDDPTASWSNYLPSAVLSRVPRRDIGRAFAARSLDLEQLAVSYMVDAEDFFRACSPDWAWPRLEALALTSQLLRFTEQRRQKIDSLLYDAGVAALRMPRLRTLVLWNGGKGHACAFICHADRRQACLTWRGTWEMEPSSRVVEIWEAVALKCHSRGLRVERQQIHGAIRNHGDAIHHLDLPCRVVEPETLWQIRREAA